MKEKLAWLLMATVAMVFLINPGSVSGASPSVTLEVLNPRGEIPAVKVTGLVPRVTGLGNKTIALVDNGKAGADNFLTAVEELLKGKVPNAKIVRFKKPGTFIVDTPQFNREVAQKCDTFVFATAD